MKGRVIDVNHRNGLVAVQLENGECSIFEPLGGYSVEIGDIISGEIDFDVVRMRTTTHKMNLWI